ncbi:MAG: hypothetical protein MI919_00095, partial [Holophagales bacterium]|nr:hypothetical protein [Holophagales bacterium]
EKVCDYEQVRRMCRGAAISDIAIDQGGSIAHEGHDEADDAVTSRAKYIELLGDDYAYYAEVNMPREEPRAASEEHGEASLPYVTALLALVAREGSTAAAVRRLLELPPRLVARDEPLELEGESPYWSAVLQDLRNGLQLARPDGEVRITDPDIEGTAHLAEWIHACAAAEPDG